MRDGDLARSAAWTVAAEWSKLRSLPNARRALTATLGLTALLGILVCASVDTSGGVRPGCRPGEAGCGDEDMVLNSLSGVYVGQLAVVTLAVLAITGEHATGVLRTAFVANPRRLTVLASKAVVVGVSAFVVGLVAGVVSFVVGLPILEGNGFTPEGGYPPIALTDGSTLRAVVGTALYLSVIALLSLGVGAVVRRGSVAVSTMVGLLYVPMMVALIAGGRVGDTVQQVAPMTAGLAIQRTVERADSVPIGHWAGLGVAGLWALAALGIGAWLTRARDA